jgi:hypothetical protein
LANMHGHKCLLPLENGSTSQWGIHMLEKLCTTWLPRESRFHLCMSQT